MLIRLLAISGAILVAAIIISQMLIPAFTDKPVFWLFRRTGRKREKVAEEIRELNEQGDLAALEDEAARLRRTVTRPQITGKETEKDGQEI